MSETRFVVREKIQPLGIAYKQNHDRSRIVVDFSEWVDEGESIGGLTDFTATATAGTIAWQVDYPFAQTDTLTDTDTLTLHSWQVVDGTKAELLIDDGTKGLQYIVSFTVTGSVSGRVREVDFFMSVLGFNDGIGLPVDPHHIPLVFRDPLILAKQATDPDPPGAGYVALYVIEGSAGSAILRMMVGTDPVPIDIVIDAGSGF